MNFEDVVIALQSGNLLADVPHPSDAYEHQRLLVVWMDAYTFAVPYVRKDETQFLKTLFPSRKLHRQFGRTGA